MQAHRHEVGLRPCPRTGSALARPRNVHPPRARIPTVLPDRAKRWVLDVFGDGNRMVHTRRLALGGWHVNHAVSVLDQRGYVHRTVLRRWARPGWELEDPEYTVLREVRVLGLLQSSAIRAPSVLASDPDGARCDVPAVLLSRLPGHPPTRADSASDGFCRQLAETLAAIHDLAPAPSRGLTPTGSTTTVLKPRSPLDPGDADLEPRDRDRAPTAVEHRDHADPPRLPPENTLWSRRRLTGIVDWTQASSGPPGLDVGHMRWARR